MTHSESMAPRKGRDRVTNDSRTNTTFARSVDSDAQYGRYGERVAGARGSWRRPGRHAGSCVMRVQVRHRDRMRHDAGVLAVGAPYRHPRFGQLRVLVPTVGVRRRLDPVPGSGVAVMMMSVHVRNRLVNAQDGCRGGGDAKQHRHRGCYRLAARLHAPMMRHVSGACQGCRDILYSRGQKDRMRSTPSSFSATRRLCAAHRSRKLEMSLVPPAEYGTMWSSWRP